MSPPVMQILIDEIFLKCSYGHLRTDFWSCIIELVARNPNLGIPALEDGPFENLLAFDYLYYILFKREGEIEGKGKGKRISLIM